MKAHILTAILCGAINLLAQPSSSTAKNESKPTIQAQATSTPQDTKKPPADTKATESSSPHWYASSEWWLVVIAALTGGAIAYQAREMARTTKVMEGQLKEMQEAGKQAAKQLSLTERPWISPSVYIISPLTADENGIHITLRIELNNVGNSPAVGIWIEPSLYLQHISKPSIVDERKRICEQAVARSPKWGQIVFPKASPPYMQDFTISATAEDVQKSRVGSGDVVTDMIAPEIILCVTYRSTIDEKAHYTAIIYSLSKLAPKRPNAMFGLRVGESVPKEGLMLYGSIFGPIAE
jgi:hypothetical protein